MSYQDSMAASAPLLERIEQKIERQGSCWVWTGSSQIRDGKRYGFVREGGAGQRGGRGVLAHRAAWSEVKEEEPPPRLSKVCETELCVNPEHWTPAPKRGELSLALYRRRAGLKKKYGITLERYDEMYEEQDGCCGSCGVKEEDSGQVLEIDHCHGTGVVRMLLCWRCNRAFGMLGDDVEMVRSLLAYAERFVS